MIEPDTTFQLNGVTSNMRMKHVGGNTVAVLAVIQKRVSKGRENPPDCGNGYDTASLAFAKGHVIALEIGGADSPRNVVPQFEHWQGKPNGAWRIMETAIFKGAFANHIMLVEIGYGRGGAVEVHDVAQAAFEANRLRDWTDPKIPDSFTVRVWNSALNLATVTNDGTFDTAVTGLALGAPAFTQTFILGNQMPEPDRAMYIVQYGLDKAYELAAIGGFDDNVVAFMLEIGSIAAIRAHLALVPGVTGPEAAGQSAFAIMAAAQNPFTKAILGRAHKKRRLTGPSEELVFLQ